MLKDEISIVDGTNFVVSDRLGDIVPGNGHGFFRSDTRFLSALVLTINGARLVLLSSRSTTHDAAAVYATNPALDSLPRGSLVLVRERRVNGQLIESLSLTNHAGVPAELTIELECGADFADIFEVNGNDLGARPLRPRIGRRAYALRFGSRGAGMRWATVIRSVPRPEVVEGRLRYRVSLAPRDTWQMTLEVLPMVAPNGRKAARGAAPVARSAPVKSAAVLPRIESDFPALQEAFGRAVQDLQALRVAHPSGHVVPAAGLPWFMAMFGRDSLITGMQTLALDSELARGALSALAEYQATEDDAFRDAEPGKLPHEIRHGRLSHGGRVPHSRYYGTIDATPLYLTALAETVRWTGDLDLARALMPTAEAALEWIDRYGDQDGDGFVEYQSRSPRGLENQGWKDSHDSIQFRDGRLAVGPIALCEVQGYVYQAKRSMAWLYRKLGRQERAASLRDEAKRLRRAFNARFWLADQGIYALALDGEKRPVDAVTSNAGQCLWTGIADRDKANVLANRLLGDDLFSGWGIRTLSTEMDGYNPVSYHNGSVWPHDNSLIAVGLARYGHTHQASRVIRALLEAASHFPGHRLPELFSGFSRQEHEFPVDYPFANAPQAWAAGAVILMAQTWLGLAHEGEQLMVRPLPGAPRIAWRDVAFRNQRLDVVWAGHDGAAASISEPTRRIA